MLNKKKTSLPFSEKNIFNAILASLEYGLTIQDRDYNILFQNDFMRMHFGSSSGKCYKIYEFRDTPCKGCPVEKAFSDEKSHDSERIVREPTGELRIWANTAIPIRNDEGEVVACLEIVRDIGPQKQFEKRLAESERRLNALMDNLPGVAYRCKSDQNLSTEYLSNGCDDLFGYKSTNLLEKSDFSLIDLIHPEDRKQVRDAIHAALAEKRPYKLAYRIHTAQKEEKWVWEKGRSIIDISGKVIALEGFITDITEQKLAEVTLKENENFLSSIIENIPNMIFVKDAKELKLIRVNKAGEDLLGFDRKDLIGKSDCDLFPREQADFFTQNDRIVLSSGRLLDISEEPIETRTGCRIIHTKKIPILSESGEPRLLLGIAEDITLRKQEEREREKLQVQLAQAQKMESVGRLAGGIAHDFNNMLSVILGHTELALTDIDPGDPFSERLIQIKKAAEHSSELTNQLLAFARKQTVIPKVLDLNETVEGMLKMLRRLIGEDINLIWSPGTGIHPIKIDPSQFNQILANLCVNARDAIVDVGKVIIETGQMSFDKIDAINNLGCTPGDYAMLSVTDSGCGMTQETIENVFEPFYTTKEHGKGTGLGLAMVYGIVTQNRGWITVYSEPDKGSTFKIYLPSHKMEQKTAPKKPREEDIPLGCETILLVEDEPAILEISRLILEKLGYNVLSARLPGEALELAGMYEGDIQMLMTDVVMPEMNGKDLAEKLVAGRPGLKCLFASGYTGDIIAHHGMLGDDVHFISKPFTLQNLAAKVREVLD